MSRSVLLKIAGLLVLFFLIFCGLAVLHFSGTETRQTRTGELRLTTVTAPAAKTDEFPRELVVGYRGISFPFGRARPVTIVNLDGTKTIATPTSYSIYDGKCVIAFGNMARVAFSTQGGTGYFRIDASYSSKENGVEIPFRLDRSTLQEELGGQLSLESGTSTYNISLANGTIIDNQFMILSLSGEQASMTMNIAEKKLHIAAKTEESLSTALLQDESVYLSVLNRFAGMVYEGLKTGRIVKEKGAWLKNDNPYFSETALMTFTAETLSRGQWQENGDRILSMARNHSRELSWRSVVYFGHTQSHSEELDARDRKFAAQLAAAVAAQSVHDLPPGNIIQFSRTRLNESGQKALYEFLGSVDPKSLLPEDLAILLSAYADSYQYWLDQECPFTRALPDMESILKDRTRKNAERLFIVDSGFTCNSKTQIALGMALVKLGKLSKDSFVQSLGQRLVHSLLIDSDQSGFIPATYAFTGNTPATSVETLLPESVYEIISDNPWYPREIDLGPKLHYQAWVYTCSPRVAIEGNASELDISMDFPEGKSHFALISGLKPFSSIVIYGIPYNPDYEFETYSVSGYFYSREESRLFLKMKHKQEKEHVVLGFQ